MTYKFLQLQRRHLSRPGSVHTTWSNSSSLSFFLLVRDFVDNVHVTMDSLVSFVRKRVSCLR
jgi:hypothetical protein